MKSLISIIIPVYNVEKYLPECLESVINQTYKNLEILLIDDGSPDNSGKICDEYAEKDARIKVIHKENGGVSSARNLGLDIATGDYITFVDSDDVVDKNYVFSLRQLFSLDVDMVVFGAKSFTDDINFSTPLNFRFPNGIYSIQQIEKKFVDIGALAGFSFPSVWAVLYRTEIIKRSNIRFNRNVYLNEDGLFNVEYLFKCTQKIVVDFDKYVYFYRANLSSATKTLDVNSFKFVSSMDTINKILTDYVEKYPNCDIQIQLKRRFVFIELTRIINLISKKSISKKEIKQIISSADFKEGLKEIQFSALSFKKKLMFIAFKLKDRSLIYFLVKLYLK